MTASAMARLVITPTCVYVGDAVGPYPLLLVRHRARCGERAPGRLGVDVAGPARPGARSASLGRRLVRSLTAADCRSPSPLLFGLSVERAARASGYPFPRIASLSCRMHDCLFHVRGTLDGLFRSAFAASPYPASDRRFFHAGQQGFAGRMHCFLSSARAAAFMRSVASLRSFRFRFMVSASRSTQVAKVFLQVER